MIDACSLPLSLSPSPSPSLSLFPLSVQGAMDLFWLPVQQYQEDGRIIWGIQRGANSFVTSSGVAVVELSNRMLQSVEVSSDLFVVIVVIIITFEDGS